MSVSAGADQPAALVAAQQAGATVVGRHLFYNNSRFDGNNPAADATDDLAIAPDKQALLVGQTATFANYSSYSSGINGVMIDVANLAGTPTLADFQFAVGTGNNPANWTLAPNPNSIAVRPGAGVNGSTRITLTWSDGAIENQWLQVTVRPTANIGIAHSDVFFFGNLIGWSGARPNVPSVVISDQSLTRNSPFTTAQPAPITNRVDFNRDGLVNSTDELIIRSHLANLPALTPSAAFVRADVLARHVFYNNSAQDGFDPLANANDDLAIDAAKQVLLPGGTATAANFTTFADGINGIMIDVANLGDPPLLSDFEFRVGNDNNPAGWQLAPSPFSITVRPGAGVNGSDRVTLVWQDGALRGTWLQVTLKATARTWLTAPDVFYIGNSPSASGGNAAAANSAAGLTLINLAQAAAPPNSQVAYADFVSSRVIGRYVYYNNSQFDGNNPASNAADDLAIASDKFALLPNETATFNNVTSYTRGINGIMIDVTGLPATPTLADLEFRIGNDGDPSGWQVAPNPTRFSVRAGAGVGGSTRLTVIWPDGWVRNTWLQVTLKATPNTGLKAPDVFYFGNLVGESGNDDRLTVTTADTTGPRANPSSFSNPAPVTSPFDYNRDTLVNSTDEQSAMPLGRRLALFTPPIPQVEPPIQRQQVSFFAPGDEGFHTSFAPALVQANDGTLLAFVQGRWSSFDIASQAMVIKRSTDNGVTWSAGEIIFSFPPNTTDIVGGASPVVDQVTGEIFLPYTLRNSEVYLISSQDNGRTWSSPVDITRDVKVTAQGNPNPSVYPNDPWGWYATGPGHGIQIQNGPYAGRLVVTADHRFTADTGGPSWSHVIYSDDHGATWHLGGGPSHSNPQNEQSNENSVFEAEDGSLYMGIRMNNAAYRGYSRSFDGGLTWTDVQLDPRLTTFEVHGSLLRINDHTVVFASPYSTDGTRHQLTIWVSFDDGVNWTKTKSLSYDFAGYSDMVLVGPDTVLIAYNAGHANQYSADYVSLARFNLDWLLNSEQPVFNWYFNEEAPGGRPNLVGTSLLDSSVWDNRAGARANSDAEAPTYVNGVHAGDSALAFTEGSDYVELSPANSTAFQTGVGESFTAELTFKTTDANGVIIGNQPGGVGWSLVVVNGKLEFSVADASNVYKIASDVTVNDGQWHRIVAVRDGAGRRLRLYIDNALAGTTIGPLGTIITNQRVTMGAYNDGSGQLAVVVDTFRFSRSALPVSRFMSDAFVAPPRFTIPDYPADAPTSIAGLQLWMPAYDPQHYFSALRNSDPLPLDPLPGIATQSAYDASGNNYRLTVSGDSREVLYAHDDVVGSYWQHAATAPYAGSEWVVQNPDNGGSHNFDFVQNTGVFTLSAFIKPGPGFGIYMALFDTVQGTATNSGFSLALMPNGQLGMSTSGPNGNVRINGSSPAGLINRDQWYHIAVVGNGPGQPLTFYVTPVSAQSIAAYQSTAVMTGPNGDYPSQANLPLRIGALTGSGQAAYQGGMVDQAIFNRALTAAEIQQLFDFTKNN